MYSCGSYCGSQSYSGSSAPQGFSSYSSARNAYSNSSAYTTSPRDAYVSRQESTTSFAAETFLDPVRPAQPFIGDVKDIAPFVEQAFETMMGSKIPNDVTIQVVPESEMHRHSEDWSPSTRGFARNRVGWGVSDIIVVADDLDRMLLVVGHELGHVMSAPLPTAHDEEAKAFAFSMAWMKTIRENDIAGIGDFVTLEPAKNGLHDVACDFVCRLIEAGQDALDVFVKLTTSIIRVR